MLQQAICSWALDKGAKEVGQPRSRGMLTEDRCGYPRVHDGGAEVTTSAFDRAGYQHDPCHAHAHRRHEERERRELWQHGRLLAGIAELDVGEEPACGLRRGDGNREVKVARSVTTQPVRSRTRSAEAMRAPVRGGQMRAGRL